MQTIEVTCYWDASDRETGHSSINEITENYAHGEVAEVEHVAVVRTSFHATLPPAEDAGSDDAWEIETDTREQAEKAVSDELARRKAAAEA
ncbi:hypothetical protein FBZ83_12638 [Azospirillum brasilense]|uniref:Uncharacterized protein n=1 Tax=Azospirillum brasilense TaxID=192 RepID=A0A560BMZ4_AZOBR|nr:hypothetical protein [Azospirillum brasilense]TWA73971.1 hypothetical protein FBZ83_12638 [Azospirillum brasilense]